MKKNFGKALALLSILSFTTAFNILDMYPDCDNNFKIGICRNYVVYGLVDAATLYQCINGNIGGNDVLSVQNIINLNQNKVILVLSKVLDFVAIE